jgi:S-adenosylmethionine:tRNA ribosyltransferase-isomerase
MNIADFDYNLPPDLIAQRPLAQRDASRLMVVFRKEGKILHSRFGEFPEFLDKGDLLVVNDTKVIPAKAFGKKEEKKIEFLFIKEKASGVWEALCRPAKHVKPGDRIVFVPGFEAEVIKAGLEGQRTLKFSTPDVVSHLREVGYAPLPPYIKRKKSDAHLRPQDLDRYQTVFAEKEGAIAAPTAGLHFTPRIIEKIRQKGVQVARVTLDVGLATFQPMRVERLEDHKMLEETYSISERTAAEINQAKSEHRPVVAVGTTVVRTLESAAQALKNHHPNGDPQKKDKIYRERESAFVPKIQSGRDNTSLFIYPGYEFKIVDRLLTNFHLPKSTLLMLVAAFSGRELILQAYREAISEKYRFFSYGDCMLII